MDTALDLITDILYEIGAASPGDSIPDADAQLVLRILNRMIDSDTANRGKIYTVGINKWPTQPQKQSYTIGVDPTGALTPDWAGPRPVKITRANLLLPTSPVIRRKIRIFDDTQWAGITLQEIYTYPEILYNDGNHPLSTIYFKPIPDNVYEIELYTWQAIAQLTDLTTPIVIPPGYEEYWLYNGAVRASVPFGKTVSADTRAMAVKSAQAITALNAVAPRLKNDAVMNRPGGRYNYLAGLSD